MKIKSNRTAQGRPYIWTLLALALILALTLLTACGGGNNNTTPPPAADSGSSSGTPASDSGGSSSSTTPPASDSGSSSGSAPASNPGPPFAREIRDVEVPAKPVDLADNSIWFVEIDGVRFNLMDVTVQDFLDAGFYLDEYDDEDYFDENTAVEPNSTIGGDIVGASFHRAGRDGTIYLIPINRTDHSIPVKDCEIHQILFNTRSSTELNIFTVCNLTVGSSEEDVISVFGEDHEDFGDVSLTYAEHVEQLSNRYFCFIKNADGIIYEIMIDTNKRVIYDWEEDLL